MNPNNSDTVYSEIQKRVVKAIYVSPRDGNTAASSKNANNNSNNGGSSSQHVGSSTFVSIQQALQMADPYTRIILGSGQYFETLSISRPVEIVADEGSIPEIINRGTCIVISQDVECFFHNLRFVSKSATTAAAIMQSSAAALTQGIGSSIRILAGAPMFAQCECTSVFAGGRSDPTFLECKINGSLACPGVIISGEASGTFTRNLISNHIPYCVSINSTGKPEFIDNDICQSAKAIKALQRGGGGASSLQNATSSHSSSSNGANGRSDGRGGGGGGGGSGGGVGGGGASATPAGGDTGVTHSGVINISRHRSGNINNSKTDSSNNNNNNNNSSTTAGGPSSILSPSSPTSNNSTEQVSPVFKGNMLRDDVVDSGLGSITAFRARNELMAMSRITGQQHQPQQQHQPNGSSATNNTSSIGGSWSIAMMLPGGATSLETAASHAERAIVRVDGYCSPTLIENSITGGLTGVAVMSHGRGTFVENTISRSGHFGVMMGSHSSPTWQSNTVCECSSGVLAANGARASFTQNIIRDNKGAGIVVIVNPSRNVSSSSTNNSNNSNISLEMLLQQQQHKFLLEGNAFISNDTGILIKSSWSTVRPSSSSPATSRHTSPNRRVVVNTPGSPTASPTHNISPNQRVATSPQRKSIVATLTNNNNNNPSVLHSTTTVNAMNHAFDSATSPFNFSTATINMSLKDKQQLLIKKKLEELELAKKYFHPSSALALMRSASSALGNADAVNFHEIYQNSMMTKNGGDSSSNTTSPGAMKKPILIENELDDVLTAIVGSSMSNNNNNKNNSASTSSSPSKENNNKNDTPGDGTNTKNNKTVTSSSTSFLLDSTLNNLMNTTNANNHGGGNNPLGMAPFFFSSSSSSSSITVIANCTISRNTACGISVIGATSQILLRDLELSNNGSIGIYCTAGAAPICHRVAVDKGNVGMLVERCARPVVVRCSFMSQLEAGVFATNRGGGFFAGNSFGVFRLAGAHVEDGSNPLFLRNQMRQSALGAGMRVSRGGIGRFVANHVEACAIGIDVATFGDCEVCSKNSFVQCTDYGMLVHDSGVGTYTENTIERCRVGCSIFDNASPTIRNNTFVRNNLLGIHIGRRCDPLIEKNSISYTEQGPNILIDGTAPTVPIVVTNNTNNTNNNTAANNPSSPASVTTNNTNNSSSINHNTTVVTTVTSTNPIIVANHIFRSYSIGISSTGHDAGGIVERNLIECNKDCGVSSSTGSRTLFKGNKIVNTRDIAGIVAESGSLAVFENNSCCCRPSNTTHPFSSYTNTNNSTGVFVSSATSPLLTAKYQAQNATTTAAGLLVKTGSHARFVRCSFSDNTNGWGVCLQDGCGGEIVDCRVERNGLGGLTAVHQAANLDRCVLRRIHFGENKHRGILMTRRTVLRISDCIFEGHSVGIDLYDAHHRTEIKKCLFVDNQIGFRSIGEAPKEVLSRALDAYQAMMASAKAQTTSGLSSAIGSPRTGLNSTTSSVPGTANNNNNNNNNNKPKSKTATTPRKDTNNDKSQQLQIQTQNEETQDDIIVVEDVGNENSISEQGETVFSSPQATATATTKSSSFPQQQQQQHNGVEAKRAKVVECTFEASSRTDVEMVDYGDGEILNCYFGGKNQLMLNPNAGNVAVTISKDHNESSSSSSLSLVDKFLRERNQQFFLTNLRNSSAGTNPQQHQYGEFPTSSPMTASSAAGPPPSRLSQHCFVSHRFGRGKLTFSSPLSQSSNNIGTRPSPLIAKRSAVVVGRGSEASITNCEFICHISLVKDTKNTTTNHHLHQQYASSTADASNKNNNNLNYNNTTTTEGNNPLLRSHSAITAAFNNHYDNSSTTNTLLPHHHQHQNGGSSANLQNTGGSFSSAAGALTMTARTSPLAIVCLSGSRAQFCGNRIRYDTAAGDVVVPPPQITVQQRVRALMRSGGGGGVVVAAPTPGDAVPGAITTRPPTEPFPLPNSSPIIHPSHGGKDNAKNNITLASLAAIPMNSAASSQHYHNALTNMVLSIGSDHNLYCNNFNCGLGDLTLVVGVPDSFYLFDANNSHARIVSTDEENEYWIGGRHNNNNNNNAASFHASVSRTAVAGGASSTTFYPPPSGAGVRNTATGYFTSPLSVMVANANSISNALLAANATCFNSRRNNNNNNGGTSTATSGVSHTRRMMLAAAAKAEQLQMQHESARGNRFNGGGGTGNSNGNSSTGNALHAAKRIQRFDASMMSLLQGSTAAAATTRDEMLRFAQVDYLSKIGFFEPDPLACFGTCLVALENGEQCSFTQNEFTEISLNNNNTNSSIIIAGGISSPVAPTTTSTSVKNTVSNNNNNNNENELHQKVISAEDRQSDELISSLSGVSKSTKNFEEILSTQQFRNYHIRSSSTSTKKQTKNGPSRRLKKLIQNSSNKKTINLKATTTTSHNNNNHNKSKYSSSDTDQEEDEQDDVDAYNSSSSSDGDGDGENTHNEEDEDCYDEGHLRQNRYRRKLLRQQRLAGSQLPRELRSFVVMQKGSMGTWSNNSFIGADFGLVIVDEDGDGISYDKEFGRLVPPSQQISKHSTGKVEGKLPLPEMSLTSKALLGASMNGDTTNSTYIHELNELVTTSVHVPFSNTHFQAHSYRVCSVISMLHSVFDTKPYNILGLDCTTLSVQHSLFSPPAPSSLTNNNNNNANGTTSSQQQQVNNNYNNNNSGSSSPNFFVFNLNLNLGNIVQLQQILYEVSITIQIEERVKQILAAGPASPQLPLSTFFPRSAMTAGNTMTRASVLSNRNRITSAQWSSNSFRHCRATALLCCCCSSSNSNANATAASPSSPSTNATTTPLNSPPSSDQLPQQQQQRPATASANAVLSIFFSQSSIENCGGVGVVVGPECSPNISDCTIRLCAKGGVFLCRGSRAQITGSRLVMNKGFNVGADSRASGFVQTCTFEEDVVVSSSSTTSTTTTTTQNNNNNNNDSSHPTKSGKRFSIHVIPSSSSPAITNNGRFGISKANNTSSIASSSSSASSTFSLILAPQCEVKFLENTFNRIKNPKGTVIVLGDCLGVSSSSLSPSPSTSAFQISATSGSSLFDSNKFIACACAFNFINKGSSAPLRNNRFVSCSPAAVRLSSPHAAPTIECNHFEGCETAIVIASAGVGGRIVSNTFAASSHASVHIAGAYGITTEILRNNFTSNRSCVLVDHNLACYSFHNNNDNNNDDKKTRTTTATSSSSSSRFFRLEENNFEDTEDSAIVLLNDQSFSKFVMNKILKRVLTISRTRPKNSHSSSLFVKRKHLELARELLEYYPLYFGSSPIAGAATASAATSSSTTAVVKNNDANSTAAPSGTNNTESVANVLKIICNEFKRGRGEGISIMNHVTATTTSTHDNTKKQQDLFIPATMSPSSPFASAVDDDDDDPFDSGDDNEDDDNIFTDAPAAAATSVNNNNKNIVVAGRSQISFAVAEAAASNSINNNNNKSQNPSKSIPYLNSLLHTAASRLSSLITRNRNSSSGRNEINPVLPSLSQLPFIGFNLFSGIRGIGVCVSNKNSHTNTAMSGEALSAATKLQLIGCAVEQCHFEKCDIGILSALPSPTPNISSMILPLNNNNNINTAAANNNNASAIANGATGAGGASSLRRAASSTTATNTSKKSGALQNTSNNIASPSSTHHNNNANNNLLNNNSNNVIDVKYCTFSECSNHGISCEGNASGINLHLLASSSSYSSASINNNNNNISTSSAPLSSTATTFHDVTNTKVSKCIFEKCGTANNNNSDMSNINSSVFSQLSSASSSSTSTNSAICLRNRAGGTFSDCEIRSCLIGVLSIGSPSTSTSSSSSSPSPSNSNLNNNITTNGVFSRMSIRDCVTSGATFRELGCLSIMTQCVFANNQRADIECISAALPTVTFCTLLSRNCGLMIHRSAAGMFHGLLVKTAASSSSSSSKAESKQEAENNNTSDAKTSLPPPPPPPAGAISSLSSPPSNRLSIANANQLSASTTAAAAAATTTTVGCFIGDGAHPSISGSSFTDLDTAIVFAKGSASGCKLESNYVSDCNVGIRAMGGKSQGLFTKSIIDGCATGVVAEDGSAITIAYVTIRKCNVSPNRGALVMVGGGGTSVTGCMIADCTVGLQAYKNLPLSLSFTASLQSSQGGNNNIGLMSTRNAPSGGGGGNNNINAAAINFLRSLPFDPLQLQSLLSQSSLALQYIQQQQSPSATLIAAARNKSYQNNNALNPTSPLSSPLSARSPTSPGNNNSKQQLPSPTPTAAANATNAVVIGHRLSDSDVTACKIAADLYSCDLSTPLLIRCCHMHHCDAGVLVKADASVAMEDNFVYETNKEALHLVSTTSVLTGNQFYHKDEGICLDRGGQQPSKENSVFNRNTWKAGPPPTNTPSSVAELFTSKTSTTTTSGDATGNMIENTVGNLNNNTNNPSVDNNNNEGISASSTTNYPKDWSNLLRNTFNVWNPHKLPTFGLTGLFSKNGNNSNNNSSNQHFIPQPPASSSSASNNSNNNNLLNAIVTPRIHSAIIRIISGGLEKKKQQKEQQEQQEKKQRDELEAKQIQEEINNPAAKAKRAAMMMMPTSIFNRGNKNDSQQQQNNNNNLLNYCDPSSIIVFSLLIVLLQQKYQIEKQLSTSASSFSWNNYNNNDLMQSSANFASSINSPAASLNGGGKKRGGKRRGSNSLKSSKVGGDTASVTASSINPETSTKKQLQNSSTTSANAASISNSNIETTSGSLTARGKLPSVPQNKKKNQQASSARTASIKK